MKGGKVKNLPLEIGKGMGFNEAALHEGRKSEKPASGNRKGNGLQ